MSRVIAMPTACVIAIGDELLAGRIADGNSAYISERLAALGVRVLQHITVGDAAGALSAVLRRLGAEFEVVLMTGGLGPSEDDRTRSEVADAIGQPLDFDESIWAEIERYLCARGATPTANNRNQARFPRGARIIRNRFGSAPAFCVPQQGTTWWSLPGVPREMRGIFEEEIAPDLTRSLAGGRAATREEVLRFFGVSESVVDAWIVSQLSESDLAEYHIRVHVGEIEVRHGAAHTLLAAARSRFGTRFLGDGADDLATRLVREATQRRVTLASAESCTGGLIGERITAVPGASAAYVGGWIAYANAFKEEVLGVEADVLGEQGAVSARVACALAAAARRRSQADFAVAATGIAGPTGGTAEKPLGTTYLALARAESTAWKHFLFQGERAWVRSRASLHGLFALYQSVLGEPLEDWTVSAE